MFDRSYLRLSRNASVCNVSQKETSSHANLTMPAVASCKKVALEGWTKSSQPIGHDVFSVNNNGESTAVPAAPPTAAPPQSSPPVASKKRGRGAMAKSKSKSKSSAQPLGLFSDSGRDSESDSESESDGESSSESESSSGPHLEPEDVRPKRKRARIDAKGKANEQLFTSRREMMQADIEVAVKIAVRGLSGEEKQAAVRDTEDTIRKACVDKWGTGFLEPPTVANPVASSTPVTHAPIPIPIPVLQTPAPAPTVVENGAIPPATRVPSFAIDPLLEDRKNYPKYLRYTLELVDHDIEPRASWPDLLRILVTLENRHGFKGGRLSTFGRPDFIRVWIKNDRRPTFIPDAINVKVLEEEFAVWFGSITDTMKSEGYVAGSNGMCSVVAALHYWGMDVDKNDGERINVWSCALTNVINTLSNLL